MSISDRPSTIVRNERGLSIAGTRITLYDVMDYVTDGWSPDRIAGILRLTEAQVDDALNYISKHRAEVEAEYRLVLHQAEENRRYWEDRNRERLAQIAAEPPRSDHAELREKIRAKKAELGLP